MPGNGTVGVGAASASRSALVLLAALAVVLGPPALLAFCLSACIVASQREQHWHEVAESALVCAAVVLFAVLLFHGNPLGFHYGGVIDWWRNPGLSFGALLEPSVSMVPLGVPLGAALGACVVGVGEALAIGAEWHPLDVRRRDVEDRRALCERDRLLGDTHAQSALSSPALGAAQDGELDSWREAGYAVVDPRLGNRGLAVVGAAGSGKTVSAERLVATWARRNRRVIFADCKGTDPDLAARVVAAYIEGSGRTDIRVHVFPDEPLNGWLGTPSDIANRLLSTQDTSEPYYAATLQTAIRFAVEAPEGRRGRPCDSSAEFLARLDAIALKAAYSGTPEESAVSAVRREVRSLIGARLRFEGIFHAVAGGFDGHKSWGDSDVVFLRVPALAAPHDALAVMRLVLADISQYAANPMRKARQGDDFTLIVDEFSAISELAPQVIDLVERVRDVGGQVIVTAQSWEGLGSDDDERQRLRAAMGALLVHQCGDPERLVEVAGTERKVEQSWQLDEASHSGMGSMRMGFRMKLDPDRVRQAGVGEAWVIAGGQYLRMQVIPNRPGRALEIAQRLVEGSQQRWRRTSTEVVSEVSIEPESPDTGWLDDLDSQDDSDGQ